MKIEFLKGGIKICVENFEELLVIKNIIKKGDKILVKDKRTTIDGDKAFVNLEIEVEKIELKDSLRIGGKIVNKIPYIKPGWHFFKLEPNKCIVLLKELNENEIKLLNELIKYTRKPKLLLIFLDVLEGIAKFYVVTDFSVIEKEEYKYNYPKEDDLEKYRIRFINNVIEVVKKYNLGYYFVVRDKLSEDYLKKVGIKKIIFTSSQSIDFFLREQRKKILKDLREAFEEELIEEIEKKALEDKVIFGKEIYDYLNLGWLDKIIISIDKIEEYKDVIDNEKFAKIYFVITPRIKKKINLMGGIIGILRWPLKK